MAKPWKEVGRYGSVGLEFVITILLVGALGQWLDGRYWGGRGWGVAAGFVLGVAVAFRNLVRTASQMQADIERAEARDPDAGRWRVEEGWLHEPPGPENVAPGPDPQHSEGASGAGHQDEPKDDPSG
jgi:hypothetical protein